MASREDYTTGAPERGICSECGRDFQLTKQGQIRHHAGDIWTAGRREYRCPGAGKPPQVIWLGLGIAHGNLLLDVAAIAALLIATHKRSRQTPPGES